MTRRIRRLAFAHNSVATFLILEVIPNFEIRVFFWNVVALPAVRMSFKMLKGLHPASWTVCDFHNFPFLALVNPTLSWSL